MNTVVVDSSVVAKWFLPELDSEKARELISAASTGTMKVVVLDLALVEVANAIWKRHRLGRSTIEEARANVASLLVGPMRVENSAGVLQKGFEIAMKYDRAVYDALFVAMARELKVLGVTADEPLYNAVRQDFPEIKLLRMWVAPPGEKEAGE